MFCSLKKTVSSLIIALIILFALPQTQTFAATGLIEENFYDNITLTTPVPDTFYKNEVFLISGKINSGNYGTITGILDKKDESKRNYFEAEVVNNEFKIPIFLSEPGDFNLGLVAGSNGTSKIKPLKVLSSIPNSKSTIKASTDKVIVSIDFETDKTKINITNADNKFKKFTFTQNGNKVIYLSRQNEKSIPIRYNDFKKFTEAKVKMTTELADTTSTIPLRISTGFSPTLLKSFTATIHQFSELETESVTSSIPDKLSSVKTISFSGTLKTDSKKTGYVIKPDGTVEEVILSTASKTESVNGSTIIKSGAKFTFSYKPNRFGTYIVGIYDKEGIPIINKPVYIGSGIPLIPDFFDLNERVLFSGTYNLNTFRQELLNDINESRKKYGLSELSTTNELNTLAQNHSADMAKNNYFGHINLKNQRPEDRRIAQGIKTPVSENIAKDVSINFIHNGLMRSASHRNNILNTDWTSVGLGIKEKDGYIIVTEEFASKELSSTDLINYKDELLNEINKKRTTSSPSIPSISAKTTLESISKYLNDAIIQNDKSLNDLTQSSLDEAIKKYNVRGEILSLGRSSSLWSKIKATIVEEDEVMKPKWEYAGIDIQLTKTGTIQAILTLLREN